MRHATQPVLALFSGLALSSFGLSWLAAPEARAQAEGSGATLVQAPAPPRATDLSPSDVQQNLAPPSAGGVTQTQASPTVQSGTQNQTVSKTAVHGGVKVTTTVTTTITTTVPAARSAPPGPAASVATPAPAASPPVRHLAARARHAQPGTGHYTARRDGDGWKITRAGGGAPVAANLDLSRLRLAPVIAAAAEQGTVTLFVDGKLVAHGNGKPSLVATGLEGSVPNER